VTSIWPGQVSVPAATEWSNTKTMGLAIEAGEEEAFNCDLENPGCPLAYELPLRYGLPCKLSRGKRLEVGWENR
jgi:hypothetical protein